jgi:hypothetical protein
MLMSIKNRFIFVCNPKCASTSIEAGLREFCEIERGGSPSRKHISMESVISEYSFVFNNSENPLDSFFRFGIMRDPVQWILSWFRYRKGNKVANPLPDYMEFEDFWKINDWTKYILGTDKKKLQSDWFRDRHGTLLVDYIMPFEELSHHYSLIAEKLGLPAKLAHANKSAISADEVEISETILSEIRDFYSVDYALLKKIKEVNARGLEKKLNRGVFSK